LRKSRGRQPRNGKPVGAANSKKHSWARAWRSFALLTVTTVLFLIVIASGSRLLADYADGYRTEQALKLPDAVKVWRQEAWRQDDFFSQVRLGDLYSNNQSFAPAGESGKNPGFQDFVEAYVWYFMALRPDHSYRADDTPSSTDTIYNVRSNALRNAENIYDNLTFEQKLETRARLIYILSSRGAEGFITLGRLHSSGSLPYNPVDSNKPQVMLCMRSDWDHWYSGWLWWLWSTLASEPFPHPPVWKWLPKTQSNLDARLSEDMCNGAEVPPEPADNYPLTGANSVTSGTVALNSSGASGLPVSPPSVSIGANSGSASSGDNTGAVNLINTGGSGSGGSTSSGGYDNLPSIPSVFATSDAESLTYFQIAADLGHPLGTAYANAQRAVIRYNLGSDGGRIIADAEKRARFWTPPFEFYPGITAGGLPHSDEALPGIETRVALARYREIPVYAVGQALLFRGYLKRGCLPAPFCFRKAISDFQSSMGYEAAGFLVPPQTVRLIQMAAVDGDPVSQNRLAIMYTKGIGVPQNFLRAERWFTKAANQRYGEALFNLYVLYKVGPNGIEPDEHKATSFNTQAALAGYIPSRNELLDLLTQTDDDRHDHPGRARR
jgi:TPR repeat protein